MSLFQCEKCGCVENTALCNFNIRGDSSALCSECDPRIKRWHGLFKKKSAEGMALLSDGFLCNQEYIESDNFKWREKHQGLKVVRVIDGKNNLK